MKKIVMFIGGIETQAYFSLQMKKAFEEMGHEVCVFDYEFIDAVGVFAVRYQLVAILKQALKDEAVFCIG